MATKSKTRSAGAKKKAPKQSQKEQSERFIEAARLLEADESGASFSRAVDKIIPQRRGPAQKP
jgi:hypothetical protein